MKQLISLLLLISLISTISISCNNARELSPVEEAIHIVGLPIPMPEYLPENYEIQSINVEGDAVSRFWKISVLISDSEDTNQNSSNITLDIDWYRPGIKLMDIEMVTIGDRKAIVFREFDYIKLYWIDSQGRGITLQGNRNLELEDLVKIAESVTSPPSEVLGISIESNHDLVILRGESAKFTVHLKNNAIVPVKIRLAREDELPKEIRLYIQDDSFTLKPRESRDIRVEVKVGENAPSPTWPEPDVDDLPEELQNPPYSIREKPYYYFSIVFSYEISGEKPRPERISAQFRIDPGNLPPGMVDLQGASATADFPISPLLPTYLPEGTEPPPTGYETGREKPYSITAVYSDLRVVLCPDPGVTRPPKEMDGERTTILNIPVVIGKNRIDWWVYDIHFSVISEKYSIEELIPVAQSMMQAEPFSGSWLDRKR